MCGGTPPHNRPPGSPVERGDLREREREREGEGEIASERERRTACTLF